MPGRELHPLTNELPEPDPIAVRGVALGDPAGLLDQPIDHHRIDRHRQNKIAVTLALPIALRCDAMKGTVAGAAAVKHVLLPLQGRQQGETDPRPYRDVVSGFRL